MEIAEKNSIKNNTSAISESAWASTYSIEEVLKTLRSARGGLSDAEAKRRRGIYGTNEFGHKRRFVYLRMIFEQLKNPVVSILLISCLLLYGIGHAVDAHVILIALCINLIVALIQEKKVSRAFELLQTVHQSYIQVLRDGKRIQIKSRYLVPGDIVQFEAGDKIPADIRIMSQNNLEVNESVLTGEWVPVRKQAMTLVGQKMISEQVNMVWTGTVVVSGNGHGIVAFTGTKTVTGSISKHLYEAEEKTPLARQIQEIAQMIMIFIMIAVLGIIGIALFLGIPLIDIIITSIAVAIAGIPSGLPAAMTVVLAVGMQSVLKSNGLVRNMLAAETLGGTTWILTDKTGTLTSGNMTLSEIIMLSEHVSTADGKIPPLIRSIVFNTYLTTDGRRLNRTHIEEEDEVVISGTPIDQALVVACEKLCDSVPSREQRVAHLPFTQKRGYAAALVRSQSGELHYYAVGAPERILESAEMIYHKDNIVPLTANYRHKIETAIEKEGTKGKRIIALATAHIPADTLENVLGKEDERAYYQTVLNTHTQKAVFMSLLLFEDVIRDDVVGAVEYIRKSNVKITMVTGDNKHTARYVAKQSGIIAPKDSDDVLRGSELVDLSDDELFAKAQNVRVFARMLPDQKARLLRVLLARKEVVAMTGDGVNDAPALHRASIGIAVASGTDVAKEASDLILLKDSFSTIIASIIEGKKIIQNLRKIVVYLLSTSFSEVILVAGGLLLTAALPITPVQILWANIVEEAFVAFAFAFEKPEMDTAHPTPQNKKDRSIINKDVRHSVIVLAIATGFFLLVLYSILSLFIESQTQIQTIMFIAVSVDSIFLALSLKRLDKSIFHTNIFSNPLLIGAIGISVVILIIAFITPPLAAVLSLVPIPLWTLLVIPFSAAFHITIIEIVKVKFFKKKYAPVDKQVVMSGTRK